jgi:hypothetical protein
MRNGKGAHCYLCRGCITPQLEGNIIPTRREQIEGGLIGLIAGDALGVPYEFHPPEAIPPAGQIEMTPPVGFQRAHGNMPPTYSDDGALAVYLLDSLLDCHHFDANDFGNRLVKLEASQAFAMVSTLYQSDGSRCFAEDIYGGHCWISCLLGCETMRSVQLVL